MAKKRTEWNEKDTQYLIEVWQNNVQDLRRSKRNSKVYATMAQELNALGVKKDPKEIMTKIKNLSKKYRDEKKIIGPSGGSPSSWKYFDQVNNILGSFATNDDSLLIETTFYANDSCSSNSLLSPTQLLSPPPISLEQNFSDFSTSPEQQSFTEPSFLKPPTLIEPSTCSTQQLSTQQPSTSSTQQVSTQQPSTSSTQQLSTQQPSTSSTQEPSTCSAEQLSRFRSPIAVNKRKRKMISVHEDILQEFRRSNEAAEHEMQKSNKLMEKSIEIQDKILDLLRNK